VKLNYAHSLLFFFRAVYVAANSLCKPSAICLSAREKPFFQPFLFGVIRLTNEGFISPISPTREIPNTLPYFLLPTIPLEHRSFVQNGVVKVNPDLDHACH